MLLLLKGHRSIIATPAGEVCGETLSHYGVMPSDIIDGVKSLIKGLTVHKRT